MHQCSIPQGATTIDKVAALESRAAKRARMGQTLYLPVIFFVYGVLLGQSESLQVAVLQIESVLFYNCQCDLASRLSI